MQTLGRIGPAVNVIIALGLFAWIQFTSVFSPLERFSLMRAPVISEGKVLGVVSFHDLVLRGLMELIR